MEKLEEKISTCKSAKSTKDNDEMICKTIASSVSAVIRFSLDEKFRRACFELYGVHSTKQIENEINKRLMFLIENEDTISSLKRRRKNSKKIKENIEENTNTLGWNKTEQKSINSTDSNSQMVSHNTFQRNWLQISSQQYREVVKKRKLNFNSVPVLTHAHQNYIEVSNNNSQLCHFPSVSEISPCSMANDLVNFSQEFSDPMLNHCRENFKNSSEERAQKY